MQTSVENNFQIRYSETADNPNDWLHMMHAYTAALIGGLFIGLAAILLWIANGRVMGISGIVGSLLARPFASENMWRWSFVVGVCSSAFVLYHLADKAQWFETDIQTPYPVLITAGLLVGLGTQLGNGCTSGHGICGISRFSWRSVVATLTFMAAGIATVTVIRNFFGIW